MTTATLLAAMVVMPWWIIALGVATGVATAVVILLLLNRPR